MNNEQVPDVINSMVLDFCKNISKSEPRFVPVIPMEESKVDECFPNVSRIVETCGGRAEYGWKIWLWPSVFIEANFHAIWSSSDGELIDITPNRDGEKEILFLRDQSCEFKGLRVDNIRKNISKNKLVDEYIELHRISFLFHNYKQIPYSYGRRYVGEELDILKWLGEWDYHLRIMIRNGKSRGVSCPCGSGKKFKKCCERDVRDGLKLLKKRYGS